MANLNATFSRDASAVLTGSNQPLFPEVPTTSIQERFVHNPSPTNPLAIRLVDPGVVASGAPAALNTSGSITIPPLGFWSASVCNGINVIGTAASPVTAGVR